MVNERAKNPPRNGEGDHAEHGGGGPRILQAPIRHVKRARKLRRQLSLPEVLLLQELRKRPAGLKFRHQFVVQMVTVDFACLSHRLAIEVDGESHGRGDQPRRDAARDQLLKREGFHVMRIPAREVLGNLNGVIAGIVARCVELGPLHQPSAGPPPRSGEELQ